MDEIPKILDDIVILRKGTLAAEIKSHRNRIDPQKSLGAPRAPGRRRLRILISNGERSGGGIGGRVREEGMEV